MTLKKRAWWRRKKVQATPPPPPLDPVTERKRAKWEQSHLPYGM